MRFCRLASVVLALATCMGNVVAAEPGPATKQYNEIFPKWKAIIAEMRKLQEDYRSADPARKPEIEKRFQELVDQGGKLEPAVIDAAEKAYAEDPKSNPELTQFLTAIMVGEMQHDEYEHALKIGEMLIKAGPEDPRVYNFAGIAAFSISRFDDARKYLSLAEEKHVADEKGKMYRSQVDPYKAAWEKEEKLRAAEAKADDLPRVLMKTSKGDIEIELFENECPNTVANFLELVEKGFYNGTVFHRVLEGFMAQGGDPTGSGAGGPGSTIACECYKPEARWHYQGSLSMAHAGPNTGGSQFFLTFVPTPHLNGRHTCFGRVVKGMDVLAKLQRIDPQSPNPNIKPDKIVEATVIRKRPHPYKVEKGPNR